MLHPQLDEILSEIRRHNMIAGLITNGSYLTTERILRLNQAGLEHLQISIDNVEGDEISKKSLRALDRKLQILGQHARFNVNINSVIGGGIKHPSDALLVSLRAISLGFTSTVGVIHDNNGQLKPLNEEEQRVYREVLRFSRGSLLERVLNPLDWKVLNQFQQNLVTGRSNNWRCRAGARYLYICENGLVHYCSQQRGRPAIPLANYTMEDFEQEYRREKKCAPFCTISCVQRTALLDNWRDPQI